MTKDYLLEEIVDGLNELAPFSQTLQTQAVVEVNCELSQTLQQAEIIVEHLSSCIISLRKTL